MKIRKKCILIVEDDPIAAYLHESLIREIKNIECFKAFKDGAEALRYLNNDDHPSLIFLDLLMPGIDGFEFLEKFQKLPLKERTQIVVLSAHIRQEEIKRAYELGAVEVIEKPSTEEKMKMILEKHF